MMVHTNTPAPDATPETLVVSVEEAARLLHNTPDSIRRKLRAGRLTGARDEEGRWTEVHLPAQAADSEGGRADKSPGGRPRAVTHDPLQALLAEKDARIADLQQRVESLEGQVASLSERLVFADRERLALLTHLPALEDHSQDSPRRFRWPWQRE